MQSNLVEDLCEDKDRLVGLCGYAVDESMDHDGLVVVAMKPVGGPAPRPWRAPASGFEGSLFGG